MSATNVQFAIPYRSDTAWTYRQRPAFGHQHAALLGLKLEIGRIELLIQTLGLCSLDLQGFEDSLKLVIHRRIKQELPHLQAHAVTANQMQKAEQERLGQPSGLRWLKAP